MTMSFYCIKQKRVNKLRLMDDYNSDTIQIGIPVLNDEAANIGLKNVGDVTLPSQHYGPACRKNADGYSWADKSKEKENRYVSTIWSKPYGNENASEQAVDIFKECYPKAEVEPTEIEMMLYEDKDNNKYVIANLTTETREKHLKEAINIFLEVFGYCNIYKYKVVATNDIIVRKCNWEILKSGELPSRNIVRNIAGTKRDFDAYHIKRLEVLESYSANEMVEGIRGYSGYYAFVFDDYCIFESAKYGNATYIVDAKDWETLSQLTKRELFELSAVEERIVHNKCWEKTLRRILNTRGIN